MSATSLDMTVAREAGRRAYDESRRPHRPVLHQRALEVPKLDERGRPVKDHTTSVIPRHPKPITWKEARRLGLAYARVMQGLPQWPTKEQAEAIEADFVAERAAKMARKVGIRPQRFHSAAHHKRGGVSWWQAKFADLVDDRSRMTMPAYRERKQRIRRPQPGALGPQSPWKARK